GTFTPPLATGQWQGRLFITARYQDQGNKGAPSLIASTQVELRPNRVDAYQPDGYQGGSKIMSADGSFFYAGALNDGDHLYFKDVDLRGIGELRITYNSKELEGLLELRQHTPDGPLMGTATVRPAGQWEVWFESTIAIDTASRGDLYLIIRAKNSKSHQMNIRWLDFRARL
ncbi:MAG: carbohydrate-binding protein, partial [Cytophagales bacterium]|nr:carbohydrate-binding protein [Cytophagales bacterium]